jgi:hypothetical protein
MNSLSVSSEVSCSRNAAGDVGSILQESITTYLTSNAATLNYLGSSLHFGTLFRATSCVSFNGVKTLSFAMSVRGNKDGWTVLTREIQKKTSK